MPAANHGWHTKLTQLTNNKKIQAMKAKENTVNNTLSTNEFNGMTIIDRLENLTEKVRNSQLKPELFIENAALIQSLATSLNLTPCQTAMLCPFFDNAFSHQSKNDLK